MLMMTLNIPVVETTDTHEWRCKHCHTVIGQVTVVSHIRRLEMVDRGVVLTGSAEVRCLKCGQVRTWFAAEEGMEHLLERIKGKQ